MPGSPRWPALAVNPSQEISSNLSSLEAALGNVDSAIASVEAEVDSLDTKYVELAGDTMTGILGLPQGFKLRVLADNPNAGEDTLWIVAPNQDGIDHINLGPTTAANYLKRIRLRADELRVEGDGQIRFDLQSAASGGDVLIRDTSGNTLLQWDDSAATLKIPVASNFSSLVTLAAAAGSNSKKAALGEGYDLYTDNTGSGTDNSRLWVDTPNDGQVVIGPRGSANFLDNLTLRSQALAYAWEDAGGDQAIHTWPKGIVYDFGYAEETAGDNVATTKTTILSATASVPADISVSVLAWGFVTFNNNGDNSDRRFAEMDVGGSGGVVAVASIDDITSSQNDDHTHSMQSHTHSDGTLNTSTDSGHNHGVNNSTGGPSSSSTGNEVGFHEHTLGPWWQTLTPMFRRSFVPTGSTVSVNLRVQTEASTETFANKALMYMVVVN